MRRGQALRMSSTKVLRTAALLAGWYAATGTAMVVKSRWVPVTHPATRAGLPPYPQTRRHVRG
jgi:hypothetical protein